MDVTKLLPFISSVVLLVGCNELIVGTAESDFAVKDFDAAWKRVDAVYPYLTLKQINWDSVYSVYKPRAEQAKGDEIFSVLIDMLGELKDMHVEVATEGGRMIETYQGPRWLRDKHSYSPMVVRNCFDGEHKVTGGGWIEYGIIRGNTGYIYVGTFNVGGLLDPFYEALDHVRNTKGLIVDIRHNNGGSSENVEMIVDRFITSVLEKPESYVLGRPVSVPPFRPEGPFQYVNPVVVLI